MTHPFTYSHLSEEAVEALLDKNRVARAYAVAGFKKAAASVGVGLVLFRMALVYHGIRIRNRGERPPGLDGYTIEEMTVPREETDRMRVLRAHLEDPEAGCPPMCPGVDKCMSRDGECLLREIVEGESC